MSAILNNPRLISLTSIWDLLVSSSICLRTLRRSDEWEHLLSQTSAAPAQVSSLYKHPTHFSRIEAWLHLLLHNTRFALICQLLKIITSIEFITKIQCLYLHIQSLLLTSCLHSLYLIFLHTCPVNFTQFAFHSLYARYPAIIAITTCL